MARVHIVNHTHWDREWYFSSMHALSLSDSIFSDILDELMKYPEVSFILDGQISILEDYLDLHPERESDIKKLVAGKQLFIGPWYTQTDCVLASGEAILRNAMIGMTEARRFGEVMKIAYLPDTFGFNAQMPAIVNHLGMDEFLFYRGISFPDQVQSPYFKWKSLGSSEVYTVNLPQGYGAGMLLEPTREYVDGRLDKAADYVLGLTDMEDVLVPSGNDQLDIVADLPDKVAAIGNLGKHEYRLSSCQDFFDILKGQKDLEVFQGEFYEPVQGRVHKTVSSVRMDLKQMIFHAEQRLVRETEPLMVLARSLDIPVSVRLVVKAWKKLQECQAHDSLAGCVSDSVAQDIRHRLKEVRELCDSVSNIIEKKLAEKLALTKEDLLVFNMSPAPFSGWRKVRIVSDHPHPGIEDHRFVLLDSRKVDARDNILEETPSGNRYITEPGYWIHEGLLDCSLPGLGYRVFRINNDGTLLQKSGECSMKAGKLTVRFDGSHLDLEMGERVIRDFVFLTDEGNAGDTYDFSPLAGDSVIRLPWDSAAVEEANGFSRMTVRGTAALPASLESRSRHLTDGMMAYTLVIDLYGEEDLRLHLELDNRIDCHRVRLGLRTGTRVDSVMASIPYGYLERTNRDIREWEDRFLEKPVNIEHFETTVSTLAPGTVLTACTADTREYEYDDDILYLTVLATTDQLGKPDLINRPGRASGDTTKKGHVMMPTPDALLHGGFKFDAAMRLDERFDGTIIRKWANKVLLPDVSYQSQSFNYFIYPIDNKIQPALRLTAAPRSYSLFECGGLVTSVMDSYRDQDDFVIRFENPTDQTVTLPVVREDFDVTRINALEEPQPWSNRLAPWEIASFRFHRK